MDNEEFEDAKMQRREDSHIKTLIPQRKSIQKLMASSRFDVMELRWTIEYQYSLTYGNHKSTV
jgi:hypothetical protein